MKELGNICNWNNETCYVNCLIFGSDLPVFIIFSTRFHNPLVSVVVAVSGKLISPADMTAIPHNRLNKLGGCVSRLRWRFFERIAVL